jgi:hypothetical protein
MHSQIQNYVYGVGYSYGAQMREWTREVAEKLCTTCFSLIP